jgi:hypothetical protein
MCGYIRHADDYASLRDDNQAHPARRQEAAESSGLPSLANRVARYAHTVNTSMSKAIAALVRIGVESHEDRDRNFGKMRTPEGLRESSRKRLLSRF